MAYRHDVAGDRLLVFQVYENIRADGKPSLVLGKRDPAPPAVLPTEEEKQQLESVAEGQRTFLFSNCLFQYDARGLAEDAERAERKTDAAGLPIVILPGSGPDTRGRSKSLI